MRLPSILGCEFSSVHNDILISANKLRFSYANEDIVIHANDAKSCFQQIKLVYLTQHLIFPVRLAFGANFSPAK